MTIRQKRIIEIPTILYIFLLVISIITFAADLSGAFFFFSFNNNNQNLRNHDKVLSILGSLSADDFQQSGNDSEDEACNNNSSPMEVVGASGRIGSLFVRKLKNAIGVPRTVFPGTLSNKDRPIVVATPSREWYEIYNDIVCINSIRSDDIVWIGNGLVSSEWQEDSTIILPHFGVLEVNADPVTSPISPPTYIYGKHRKEMGNFLNRTCNIQIEYIDSWTTIQKLAARKLLWASCMWLVCHDNNNNKPLTLSKIYNNDAEKEFTLIQLIQELLPCLNDAYNNDDDDSLFSLQEILNYMKSYSLSMPNAIPSKDLALIELNDRNGVWLRMNNNNNNQPLHKELLNRVIGEDALQAIL